MRQRPHVVVVLAEVGVELVAVGILETIFGTVKKRSVIEKQTLVHACNFQIKREYC